MTFAEPTEIRFADLGKIQAGDTVRLKTTVTEQVVQSFADASGDYNPLHMDAGFARQTRFQRRVAHGMILAGYVSRMIGMQLPGPGALWTQQSFRWLAPVFIGDTVEIALTVAHRSVGASTVTLHVTATNQSGETVMEGDGTAMLLETRKEERVRALSERTAVITGGSRGIGAAIALEFGRAGASVGVLYRSRRSEAEQVCREVIAAGGRAVSVEADVADAVAVAGAAARIRQAFGRPIDVLINNAGLPVMPRAFLELAWSDFQSQLEVQVRGAFHCCQAIIPGMLEAGSGRIVNIGSTLTQEVPPLRWTAFAMAKAALKSLTRSLAVEFGPKGICVNLVSPGLTETESIAEMPERLRKVQAMQTPLRRLATPADIGRAVAFLCSEQGSFITGADIPVCGGTNM
jgi:3-oxoacyl-[acyl-carrier protein] reductase